MWNHVRNGKITIRKSPAVCVAGLVALMVVFLIAPASFAAGNETLSVGQEATAGQEVSVGQEATVRQVATAGQAAAFNAVDLEDGEYRADGFDWSGGSGRLEYIKCNKILVENGGAYAELEFASKYYDYLRVKGSEYKRTEVGEDTSRFQVPVKLNTNMEIEGRTTAMSQPHWIPYTIYIQRKGASANGGAAIDTEGLAKQNKAMKNRLLDKAPVIIGFEGGEKVELTAAKHLRIFRYKSGAGLIQVEHSGSAGKGLYGQKVVNYLVLPENVEPPAGAEKQFVIIRENPQNTFVDSAFAEMILSDGQLKRELSDGSILSRGEFRELMADAGTKLCILSDDKVTADITDKLEILEIPLFIDCAQEEQGVVAKSEWALTYGEIFGQPEAAEQIVRDAVQQDVKERGQQRTAALILLVGIIAAMFIIPVTAKRG